MSNTDFDKLISLLRNSVFSYEQSLVINQEAKTLRARILNQLTQHIPPDIWTCVFNQFD